MIFVANLVASPAAAGSNFSRHSRRFSTKPKTESSSIEDGFSAGGSRRPVAPASPGWDRGPLARPAMRSERARAIFKRLSPELIRRLAAAADPDQALISLDAFLSAFVIVTPLRALWSSISYKRDDEDRRARVGHFLAAGRTAKARREADRMESVGEAASAKALAALCDGDYEDFVHQLELVDSSAQLAGVRRDPDALRHIHFMQAMSIAPINPEHFSDMLEALWQERARVASVLILSSEIAERHGGQAALEENAKGRSWGNALNEVFGLIEEHLKSGDQFAATLSERYSKEPLSLALSAVVAFQSFGSQMENAARRKAVRKQIELALKEIVGRIESDITIDGLAFAMLGNFYGAPAHFRAAFDAAFVFGTAFTFGAAFVLGAAFAAVFAADLGAGVGLLFAVKTEPLQENGSND